MSQNWPLVKDDYRGIARTNCKIDFDHFETNIMEHLKPLETKKEISFSYENVGVKAEFELNEKQIVYLGKLAQCKRRNVRTRSVSVPVIVLQNAGEFGMHRDITDHLSCWDFKRDFSRVLKELPATDLCSTEL